MPINGSIFLTAFQDSDNHKTMDSPHWFTNKSFETKKPNWHKERIFQDILTESKRSLYLYPKRIKNAFATNKVQ